MVATEPTGTFEALFRPSNHFRGNLPEGYTEVELLPGLTIENVWATGVTWDEFHRFLCHKVVWMTTNVYVSFQRTYEDPLVLGLGGDFHTSMLVRVRSGTAAAAATVTCDFLLRLLATCEHHNVIINGCSDGASTPLSGAGLSLFFQESRGSLRQVTLTKMALNADQCLALTTMSRLDVELRIHICTPADDAAGAFVECLKSDRGPVKLISCEIDSQTIAHALTGDSRVTKLKPFFYYGRSNDAETDVLVAALANNRGLLHLDLQYCHISDDNWSILCESLKAHPTLTNLNLRFTSPRRPTAGVRNVLTDEQNTHRTRLLAEMMEQNVVLRTIDLSRHEHDEQIYTEEILPYLETNLYRTRVLAVNKAIERPFREKVLGRALGCVKSNPNLVWMFLSENVDAFVRSEEEEEGNSEVPVAAAAAAPVVVGVAVSVAGSKRKL
jgi:hypothetical protein